MRHLVEEQHVATPSRELQIQPPHAGIHVIGFRSWFHRSVTVTESSGISVGNQCTLKSQDHYHVKLVTVDTKSLTDLLAERESARDALRDLVLDPDDSDAAQRFQRAIRPPDTPEAPTAYRQRLDPGFPVVITDSSDIQVGDGSTMNVDNDYDIGESALPLVELLATDRSLVKAFVEHFTDPTSREYPNALTRAAGRVDDDTILCGATRIESAPTTVLFDNAGGGIHVDSAVNGVLIGVGNRLFHELKVKHPGVKIGDLSTVTEEIRTLADIEIPEPAPAFSMWDLFSGPATGSLLPRPDDDDPPPPPPPPPPPKPKGPDDPRIRFPGPGL
jgi:hypothetical protein